jgi:lipopolysaccharide exporter
MVTSNRLRAFSRVLPNIDFARNVVVLAGGTTISQGILAITAPIITRLYTPDAFGTWSLFISLAGVLSTIACLRYELSIMLPQDGKKAAELSVLSAGIAVLLSIFLLVIVAFFRHQIAHLLGSPDLTPWLWGLPLIFLLMGLYEVGNYWSTRKKLFSRLAISRIGQSLGVVGTQIGAALSFSGGVSSDPCFY